MTAQEQISKVVNDCTDLPVSCREMLVKGLPFTFSPPKDRHEYQQEFVGVLRSTLECALKSESQIMATCQEKVKNAEIGVETAVEAHKQAVTAESDAKACLQEKVEALNKASELVKKEEEMCKEAEQQKSVLEHHKMDLEGEVQRISSIIDGSFKMLLEGGWAGDESVKNASLQALQDYLESINAEPALVAAVPGALRKMPAERRAFDGITVRSLEKVMAAKKQEVDGKLQKMNAEFVNVDSEHLGAYSIAEVAKEKKQEAQEERKKAQAQLCQRVKAVESSSSQVEEQKKILNAQLCEKALRENKVKEIKLALVSLDKLAAGQDETSMDTAEEEGLPCVVGMDVEPTLIAGH